MNHTLGGKISRQGGTSLIELMVSVSIGIILTLGLLEVFSSNKQTYIIQDGLGRLQENGRFVQYFLNRDLRMAGYQGCPSILNIEPNNLINSPPTNTIFTSDTILTAHDAVISPPSWNPGLPGWLTTNFGGTGNPVTGTDVIIVRKAASESMHLTNDMTTPTSDIEVADRSAIIQNSSLMISDCEASDIFIVTNSTPTTTIRHDGTGNSTSSLSKAYQTDANISLLETFAYYIKDTGRVTLTGLPILALYRQDINGNEAELVEGVQDMQLRFGLDTDADGSADTFQTADIIDIEGTWSQVQSVHLAILLNTMEEVSPMEQAYTFNGITVSNPGDRILRREWSTYITLRNRSL